MTGSCCVCAGPCEQADGAALWCPSGHCCCGDCMSQYILLTWTELTPVPGRIPEIKCLDPDCPAVTNEFTFSSRLICQVVSDEAWTRYEQVRFKAVEARTLCAMQQKLVLGGILAVDSEDTIAERDRQQNILLEEQLRRELPNALMCPACEYGPFDHAGCDDLEAHHREETGESSICNACPKCGFFAPTKAGWSTWDGNLRSIEDKGEQTPLRLLMDLTQCTKEEAVEAMNEAATEITEGVAGNNLVDAAADILLSRLENETDDNDNGTGSEDAEEDENGSEVEEEDDNEVEEHDSQPDDNQLDMINLLYLMTPWSYQIEQGLFQCIQGSVKLGLSHSALDGTVELTSTANAHPSKVFPGKDITIRLDAPGDSVRHFPSLQHFPNAFGPWRFERVRGNLVITHQKCLGNISLEPNQLNYRLSGPLGQVRIRWSFEVSGDSMRCKRSGSTLAVDLSSESDGRFELSGGLSRHHQTVYSSESGSRHAGRTDDNSYSTIPCSFGHWSFAYETLGPYRSRIVVTHDEDGERLYLNDDRVQYFALGEENKVEEETMSDVNFPDSPWRFSSYGQDHVVCVHNGMTIILTRQSNGWFGIAEEFVAGRRRGSITNPVTVYSSESGRKLIEASGSPRARNFPPLRLPSESSGLSITWHFGTWHFRANGNDVVIRHDTDGDRIRLAETFVEYFTN